MIKSEHDFSLFVASASARQLSNWGFKIWEKRKNSTLYLIPGDYYNFIPNGFPIVDIWYNEKTFEKGVSDNDTRLGCLPYGVLREVKRR